MSRRDSKPDGAMHRNARGTGGLEGDRKTVPFPARAALIVTLDITCGWINGGLACDQRIVRLFAEERPTKLEHIGYDGETLSRALIAQDPDVIVWSCGCGAPRDLELSLESCRIAMLYLVDQGTPAARVSAPHIAALP